MLRMKSCKCPFQAIQAQYMLDEGQQKGGEGVAHLGQHTIPACAAQGILFALEMLTRCRYFGTDNVTFTIGSEYPNQILDPRTYTSFSAAAIEIANSRVYGGIHFPSSGPIGLSVGATVSGLRSCHADLQPVRPRRFLAHKAWTCRTRV